MSIDGTKILRGAKDYVFITLGVSIYAFAFASFILPHQVVIGGVAGLSTILYYTTGLPIAVGNYACNLILLAIAYKVVGRQFVLGTIFGATMISTMMGIAIPLCQGIFDLDPFLSCVIGGILAGTGIGMAFVHNGSSGGTDIVAAMVAKYTNVTVGRTMIYVDMCIISSSFFIFHKVDTVVYGFIVLFMSSYMADLMINSNRQAVQFTIFSSRWKEIATAINNEAKRGCTVINGMGWYSKQEVKVLLVMCRKIESVTIFRIIKAIDKDAFITQANVNGVYGQGFDQMKVRMKVDTNEVTARHAENPSIEATDKDNSHSGHRIV
ncbi:MAG: YitT family protein [Muribaculaceae bacterium]|nr:YitT family protein [Muribaculaceae bacterium]